MSTIERFGVSMDATLLERFDHLIQSKGYSSRSEALRDLVRQEIVASEWENPDAEVIGTLTLVYDHHERDLSRTLTEMQHHHCEQIICTTHIHIDPVNCLEVIVVRGKASVVQAVSDNLLASAGVKHGKLVCSTTGKNLF